MTYYVQKTRSSIGKNCDEKLNAVPTRPPDNLDLASTMCKALCCDRFQQAEDGGGRGIIKLTYI